MNSQSRVSPLAGLPDARFWQKSLGMGLFCLLLAGCGGRPTDQPELGQVTGVVTLDGNPVAEAMVDFRPAQGRPSTALTDGDGRYELYFTENTKGAAVGSHTVSISTQRYATMEDGSTREFPETIPAKYNKTTTLAVEVAPGSQTHDFALTTK